MPSQYYSKETKHNLLANLALEVSHREKRFQGWHNNALGTFNLHQEGLISRMPKVVKAMKMSEFAEKYHGDIQAALRGVNAERLGPQAAEIDRDTRKRKWVESHEPEQEVAVSQEPESSRGVKTARVAVATPKKKPGSSTGPGTAQRARLLATSKTPATSRTMGRPTAMQSPIPHKQQRALGNGFPRAGPASPSKLVPNPRVRAPSLDMFKPTIPQGPSYPPQTPAPGVARMPRRDESLLSMNGSPLANPYELGSKWFQGPSGHDRGEGGSTETTQRPGHQRANSITVRRDTSMAMATAGYHSRTPSQTTSMFAPVPHPNPNNLPPAPQPSHSRHPSSSSHLAFPSSHPFPSSGSGLFATVATKNGDVLELNPLETSPGALEALEGVTDSAKKGARAEMGRLAREMGKWNMQFD